MVMSVCRECAKPASSEAKACPHCGVPNPVVPDGNAARGRAYIVIGLLIITTIVTLVISKPDHTTAPARTGVAEQDSHEDRQRANAANIALALRKTMRNPKTFEVISAHVGQYNALCYQYRAENGFGGMSVERVVVAPDAAWMTTERDDEFADRWNDQCARGSTIDATSAVQAALRWY
jgi:hypothetical protein